MQRSVSRILLFSLATLAVLSASLLFWIRLTPITPRQQSSGQTQKTDTLPNLSVRSFASVDEPILRRDADGTTEYEIIGSFPAVPQIDKEGNYKGTFTVSLGGNTIDLPILLGREGMSVFVGFHEGDTAESSSRYEPKPIVQAIQLVALRVGQPTVLRLKTKIREVETGSNSPCLEFCTYLKKWIVDYGKEAESALDNLMNRGVTQHLDDLVLFVHQVGFLARRN